TRAKIAVGAAVAGAGAAAAAHNLSPSVRNSYTPTADRFRANIAAPPGASTQSFYTRVNGFLEPTFSNLVFSPVYFCLPFNIWHPSLSGHSSSGGSSSFVSGDDMTDGSTGDPQRWSTTPYKYGEIGTRELNELPEWIQASLRLMHTKHKDGFPSDIT